jgi:hypothetical protein
VRCLICGRFSSAERSLLIPALLIPALAMYALAALALATAWGLHRSADHEGVKAPTSVSYSQ